MDMTDATYDFGTSTSGQYYVGNSLRSMGFKPHNNLSATYIYTVANYVFFDGESLFTARLSVNPNGDASEIQDMYSMISSVNSSYINSPSSDSDGDGITNFNEVIFYGSNPNQIDSNGDGINDDVIASLGGHPNWDLTSTLDYIGQNPSQFNLHSLEDITDLRAGSTMIEIHDGQATLTMEVEESDDLGIWTTGGTASVQINVQPGEDKKFFRFKMDDSSSSTDETGGWYSESYLDLVVNLSSDGSYDFISVSNHPLNDYNGVYYTQPDLINNMPYFKSSNQKYLYFYKGASGGLLSWSFYNALPDGISDLFTGGWIQPYPVLESGNFNIFDVTPE